MLGFIVRFRSRFRVMIDVRVVFMIRISVRVKFRLTSVFNFRVRVRYGLETRPGSSLFDIGKLAGYNWNWGSTSWGLGSLQFHSRPLLKGL